MHPPRWRPRGAVLAGMRAAIARLPRLGHTQRQIRRLLVAYGPMTTGSVLRSRPGLIQGAVY